MPSSEEIQRLTAFFEDERTALTRHVRYLVRSSEVAEEIVQELMLKLLQLESLPSIVNLKCYAYSAVRNLVIDYRRREANAQKAVQRFGEYREVQGDSIHFTSEECYECMKLVDQVDQILNALPEDERVAFLRKTEGFTQREIAEQTDWSVGKVNAVLQKVLGMTKHLF